MKTEEKQQATVRLKNIRLLYNIYDWKSVKRQMAKFRWETKVVTLSAIKKQSSM